MKVLFSVTFTNLYTSRPSTQTAALSVAYSLRPDPGRVTPVMQMGIPRSPAFVARIEPPGTVAIVAATLLAYSCVGKGVVSWCGGRSRGTDARPIVISPSNKVAHAALKEAAFVAVIVRAAAISASIPLGGGGRCDPARPDTRPVVISPSNKVALGALKEAAVVAVPVRAAAISASIGLRRFDVQRRSTTAKR